MESMEIIMNLDVAYEWNFLTVRIYIIPPLTL